VAESDVVTGAPAIKALGEQAPYADLQRVADSYWEPAATLGQSLVEGNYKDAQKLLDDAVAGITQ
jgi:arabinogalactan oligomer/maltooligosaccharide transport system substrate-binding protein